MNLMTIDELKETQLHQTLLNYENKIYDSGKKTFSDFEVKMLMNEVVLSVSEIYGWDE